MIDALVRVVVLILSGGFDCLMRYAVEESCAVALGYLFLFGIDA
jgi:hypothetical protein